MDKNSQSNTSGSRYKAGGNYLDELRSARTIKFQNLKKGDPQNVTCRFDAVSGRDITGKI